MYRQFNPTPLICPCCGHVLGEQAYFQSFEAKVAAWLQARMAPPATKGYDVYDSVLAPNLTIQVKYSVAYRFQSPKKKYPSVNWVWTVKSLDPIYPDYFVLFGIIENEEYCFLLSRQDFVNYAVPYKGAYTLRASAKQRSDRQNYNYVPKIWRYVVSSPEATLANAIISYIPKSNESVFSETHINRILELQSEGLSHHAIAKRIGISQSSVSRLLREYRG